MSEALNTLREQLRHPDNNLRSQAALRLGKLDDADALKLLIDALRTEPSLYVREDITWAIVRKGDAAVLPLIDLLRDPSPAARHHAAGDGSRSRSINGNTAASPLRTIAQVISSRT